MKFALRLLLTEAGLAAILFGAAGTWDRPWFWAVIVAHAVLMVYGFRSIDPELRRERFRPAPGGEDRNLRWIAAGFLVLHLIVAGLDAGRYGWSPPFPVWLQALGLIGYVCGGGFSFWAMARNPFFSPVVRVQRERGHRVIADGPYRFVRHPGYAGLLAGCVCGGIALGSWWSLVPIVPIIALFLRRTLLEERCLKAELEGYAEYAERVRYRLCPGIW